MDRIESLFGSLGVLADDMAANRVTAELAAIEMVSLLRRLAVAFGRAVAGAKREEVTK